MKRKRAKKVPPKTDLINTLAIEPPCPICGCGYLIAYRYEFTIKKIIVHGRCMRCKWPSEKWSNKVPKKLVAKEGESYG